MIFETQFASSKILENPDMNWKERWLRFRYLVDLELEKRPTYKLFVLALLTVNLVVISTILLTYTTAPASDLINVHERMWLSWTWALAPGTLAHVEEGRRTLAVFTTLGGMICFALLISLLTESLNDRMDRIRTGNTIVMEKGHTLICGWNDKIPTIIKEIQDANIDGLQANHSRVIVIVANQPRKLMDQIVNEALLDSYRSISSSLQTKVICRTGKTHLAHHLDEKGAVKYARSIIVLSEGNQPDLADAHTARICLSLVQGKLIGPDVKIIAEVNKSTNKDLILKCGLPLYSHESKDIPKESCVVPILCQQLIGRLLSQCIYQPGLTKIYNEIFSFSGSEFYRISIPNKLIGNTYLKATASFPNAIVCGLKNKMKWELNPDNTTILSKEHELLMLAEDNEYNRDFLCELRTIEEDFGAKDVYNFSSKYEDKIRVLICGQRPALEEMIHEFDAFIPKGSSLTILSPNRPENIEVERVEEHASTFRNTGFDTIRFVYGEAISVTEILDIKQFDAILLLGREQWSISNVDRDSHILISLLQIFHALEEEQMNIPNIILELADPQTEDIAQRLDLQDYVITGELIGKSLAMISEDSNLTPIFEELIQINGFQPYIVNANIFTNSDERVSFFGLQMRLRKVGYTLIGYKLPGQNPILNPGPKQLMSTHRIDRHEKRIWNNDTKLIILAKKDV